MGRSINRLHCCVVAAGASAWSFFGASPTLGDTALGPRVDHVVVRPTAIAAGNFDAGGAPEIVIASARESVFVMKWGGESGFAISPGVYVQFAQDGVATGDLNNDGIADVLVSHFFDRRVTSLLGDGSGGLETPVAKGVQVRPRGVALGDLDANGTTDAVVANSGSRSLSLLSGGGDGHFATAGVIDSVLGEQWTVSLSDLDHNGYPDIIAGVFSAGVLSVILNRGGWAFDRATVYVMSDGASDLEVSDVDRDGNADVVVAIRDDNEIRLYLGNGDGTLMLAIVFHARGHPVQVATADINGDGMVDIVVGHANYTAPGIVSVYLGNGDGTFGLSMDLAVPFDVTGLVATDIDGDMLDDIVVACEQVNTISTFLSASEPTAVTITLVKAEVDESRAILQWYVGLERNESIQVERRNSGATAWEVVWEGVIDPSGVVTFIDGPLETGSVFEYRLVVLVGSERREGAGVVLRVPEKNPIAITGVRWVSPRLLVLSVVGAHAGSASFSVFDGVGRRVFDLEGVQVRSSQAEITLLLPKPVVSGVYFVSCRIGERRITRRAVLVR